MVSIFQIYLNLATYTLVKYEIKIDVSFNLFSVIPQSYKYGSIWLLEWVGWVYIK